MYEIESVVQHLVLIAHLQQQQKHPRLILKSTTSHISLGHDYFSFTENTSTITIRTVRMCSITLGECAVGIITVVVLYVCVCVSDCLIVCYNASSYISHLYTSSDVSQGCLRHFQGLVVWLLLKALCSKVLVGFSEHHCLPGFITSSHWKKKIVMASFQ